MTRQERESLCDGAEERLAVAIHAEAANQLLALGAGEEIGEGARFVAACRRVALRRDHEDGIRVAEVVAAGIEEFQPDLLPVGGEGRAVAEDVAMSLIGEAQ